CVPRCSRRAAHSVRASRSPTAARSDTGGGKKGQAAQDEVSETIMRKIILGCLVVLSVALPCRRVAGWAHAGRFGTASGGGGSWSAHGWHGGVPPGRGRPPRAPPAPGPPPPPRGAA